MRKLGIKELTKELKHHKESEYSKGPVTRSLHQILSDIHRAIEIVIMDNDELIKRGDIISEQNKMITRHSKAVQKLISERNDFQDKYDEVLKINDHLSKENKLLKKVWNETEYLALSKRIEKLERHIAELESQLVENNKPFWRK